MRTRPSPAGGIAMLLLVLSMVFGLSFAVRAQLSKHFRGKNFRFIEYYDAVPGLKAQTNQVKNLLTGAEGQYLSNETVRITQSRLESYPQAGKGTNLVVVSPESFFEVNARIITSTSRLDLAASDGQIRLRGQTGYMFSMTNSSLIVSNRVRTFIQGAALKGSRP